MNQPNYTINFPPKNAGCWVLNNSLHIYVRKKPFWLHKKMIKLMFGWNWQDGDFLGT